MKEDNCKYEYRPTIGHDVTGKPIRKSFYGKTKKAAKAKAEQWLIENAMAGQLEDKPKCPTLNEVYVDYMKHKEAVLRPNSFYQLKCQFKVILDRFGDYPVDKIKHGEIVKFVDYMLETYAHNTVSAYKTNFSGIMKYAVQCEYISSNPCIGIGFRQEYHKTKKRVYSKEDADRIIKYSLTHPLGLAIDLMLSYGTTISETLGITIDAVDFEKKTILISQGITSVPGQVIADLPKTEFRIRTIAVTDYTLQHIKETYDPSYKYLIHTDYNSPDKQLPCQPHTFRKYIYMAFMEDMIKHFAFQGIDMRILNPHELRHTRATIYVEEDVNLFAIAEQMGWSDLKMIRKVYGHPDIQRLRNMLRIDDESYSNIK